MVIFKCFEPILPPEKVVNIIKDEYVSIFISKVFGFFIFGHFWAFLGDLGVLGHFGGFSGDLGDFGSASEL